MQLTVKLVTRPLPGIWIRVIVLVIIIIAVVAVSWTGYGPAMAAALITTAGLSAGRVVRALHAGDTPVA